MAGKGMADRRTEKPSLTEFMPANESDYLIPSKRYIAFERTLVSFLCKQDLILPNHITYFRFLICFFLLCFFPSLSYFQIFVLATLGVLSDFYDGALARAASKKTRLGMMIDPLADKLLAFTLVTILLVRGVIHPVYFISMLIVESHVVLIPLLSWLWGMLPGGKKLVGSGRDGGNHGAFIVKSREIIMGKIKVFLYALAFLCILMGNAVNSAFLLNLAQGLLISGIAAAAVALCGYLFRWFKGPYRIVGL